MTNYWNKFYANDLPRLATELGLSLPKKKLNKSELVKILKQKLSNPDEIDSLTQKLNIFPMKSSSKSSKKESRITKKREKIPTKKNQNEIKFLKEKIHNLEERLEKIEKVIPNFIISHKSRPKIEIKSINDFESLLINAMNTIEKNKLRQNMMPIFKLYNYFMENFEINEEKFREYILDLFKTQKVDLQPGGTKEKYHIVSPQGKKLFYLSTKK